MRLSLITAPTLEPLTIQEVRDFLRVTSTDEDALLGRLILAARDALEDLTGRQLLTATWDLFLDRFPEFDWEPLVVPRPPLLTVTSVTYLDTSGVSQTWPAAEYTVQPFVGPHPPNGTIAPKAGEQYPSTRRVPHAVTVRFTAGYGPNPSDVPGDVKNALLVLVAQAFEHREAVVVGQMVAEMPWGLRGLITRLRGPVLA